LLILVGPVKIIKSIPTCPLFLRLSLLCLYFLIATLRELRSVVLVKPPLGSKLRPWRWLPVNETKSGVVVSARGEGIIGSEVEDGVGCSAFAATTTALTGAGVKNASEISDSAELFGAREGSVGDVERECGGGGWGDGGVRRTPAFGVEMDGTYFETVYHWNGIWTL
jgi:hypothetical protein